LAEGSKISAIPTEFELADAIESATAKAVRALFTRHPRHYYYLSLITTGEAHPPALAAWSREALDDAVKRAPDHDAARRALEWSYADSPYYCFGEEFFERVQDLFALRPEVGALDRTAREAEYETRLRAMEAAVARLDRRGLFGVGDDRLKIIVNVEVMPPDYTNTARAKRLNPPEAIRTWLEEVAEKE
jgi:hypothetical protein